MRYHDGSFPTMSEPWGNLLVMLMIFPRRGRATSHGHSRLGLLHWYQVGYDVDITFVLQGAGGGHFTRALHLATVLNTWYVQ